MILYPVSIAPKPASHEPLRRSPRSRRVLADGYGDAAALDALKASRFAVMLPFANRIADARYRFGGKDFDLEPRAGDGERRILHGFVLVYTGDTLAENERRRSVAPEPMEAITNAFNREDCAAEIMLAPRTERHFRCGVEVHLP